MEQDGALEVQERGTHSQDLSAPEESSSAPLQPETEQNGVAGAHSHIVTLESGSVFGGGRFITDAEPASREPTSVWQSCSSACAMFPAYKLVTIPLFLLWSSLQVYLFPCMEYYVWSALERFWNKIKCGCCACIFSCCAVRFHDKEFPAGHSSLGKVNGREGPALDEIVEWKSGEEVLRCEWEQVGGAEKVGEFKPSLFAGGIEPADIAQGQIGNCWLLSAFACLAEIPGAIRQAFITKSYSRFGQYKVRLFDKKAKKWVVITVDDMIPCKNGTSIPMFANPNGMELWVLILEKAFAKFCGSYENLDGGNPVWALEALTGGMCFSYIKASKEKWNRMVMVPTNKSKRSVGFRPQGPAPSSQELFQILMRLDGKDAMLAAGTSGNDDTQSNNGLADGHAYTLLHVKEVAGHQLLCLRNPWGRFEWKGDWSDNSPCWEQCKEAKEVCKPSVEDDGCFWMSWHDFLNHYDMVDVCARTRTMRELTIDLHEEKGHTGALYGCCLGCLKYWCCCQGPLALYNQCSREDVMTFGDPDWRNNETSGFKAIAKHSQVPEEQEMVKHSSAPPAPEGDLSPAPVPEEGSAAPPDYPAPPGWEICQADHAETNLPMTYYYHASTGRSAWCQCDIPDTVCEVHGEDQQPNQHAAPLQQQEQPAGTYEDALREPAALQQAPEVEAESELVPAPATTEAPQVTWEGAAAVSSSKREEALAQELESTRQQLQYAQFELAEKDSIIHKLQERMAVLPNRYAAAAGGHAPRSFPRGRILAPLPAVRPRSARHHQVAPVPPPAVTPTAPAAPVPAASAAPAAMAGAPVVTAKE